MGEAAGCREMAWRIRDLEVELMPRIVAEAGGESLRTELRKIAIPLFYGRHGGSGGFTLAVAEAFIEREEEGFIFADWSADGGAELILF